MSSMAMRNRAQIFPGTHRTRALNLLIRSLSCASAQAGVEGVMTVSGRMFVVLAVAVIASPLAVAVAQQPTFHTATELVSLNVTVVNRNDRYVADLTQDQFAVFEDGVQQTLEFFAAGDLPLDVLILLDTSASMAPWMAMTQQAATRFVRALRPTDRATVMGIASGLRILQTVTGDSAALEQAIRSTKAGGRTLLYASLYTALRELAKSRNAGDAARRQAIVLLSDGQDTASGFGFDELIGSVRRYAVPIYTIAPRPSQTIRTQRETIWGERTHEQDFELRKLATETGGRAFFPGALHELTGIYDHIANELGHQYSLGYESSNISLDGTFRRIAVRLSVPGVTLRTRSGYIAERGAVLKDEQR